MALKIFISSVFTEFPLERKALEEEIHKLQEFFIGMEYFGGFSTNPSTYDARRVIESDIYIGLFGYEYGSIDGETGKSFTELEYAVAYDRKIPCLIYFKDEINLASSNEHPVYDRRLIDLRNILRTRHGVQPFKNEIDLKIKFLVDFIKLVRNELWHKANADQKGIISAETLQSLTNSLINEQIKIVGNDKYIPQLYVHREEVEKSIKDYVGFEAKFLSKLKIIFKHLTAINEKFNLNSQPADFLTNSQSILEKANDPEECGLTISKIKRMFYFDEVEHYTSILVSLIQEKSITKFYDDLRKVVAAIGTLEFIDFNKLSSLKHDLLDFKKGVDASQNVELNSNDFLQILHIFPSIPSAYILTRKEAPLANDLIKELSNLVQLNFKRCIVLVDKAGAGKTNVVCSLSQQLAAKYPVVLISGHAAIHGENGIESYIQHQLESLLGGNFTDWLNRISPDLEENRKWLYIFIDGINENNNLSEFAHLFSVFLPKILNKRVKVILTCRDVLWDFFAPVLSSYSFTDTPINLHNFTNAEWGQAVKAYLNYFEIKADFSNEAKEAFKNPLLLRFFCEAYKSQKLGLIQNLRLLSVFDLYIKRVSERICSQKNITRNDEIIGLLVEAADKMWLNKSTTISLAAININPKDISDDISVYNLIRNENIVFEELIHAYSTKKEIRFVYDEFMEYILARSWIDKIIAPSFSETVIDELIEKAVSAFSVYPSSFGALLFLDGMLKREGKLINKTIVKIIDDKNAFANLSQIAKLYAFERLSEKGLDDKIISALDIFERNATPEIKERLSKVILRLLPENKNHPDFRRLIERILDINYQEYSDQQEIKGDLGKVSLRLLPESKKPRSLTKLIKAIFHIKNQEHSDQQIAETKISNSSIGNSVENLQSGSESIKASEDEIFLLPPGRYHYTDETKLSAISILIYSDHVAARMGMERLGQMELHNALEALIIWDSATDDQVFKVVSEHINMLQPEYKIYCAWLLRDRFGKQAADWLIKLLINDETRVHEYTFKLLSKKMIDLALIEKILETIETETVKPWHLNHLVRLLGARERFDSPLIIDLHVNLILTVLEQLSHSAKQGIRLESYRAMLKFPDNIDLIKIKTRMFEDADRDIRNLAGGSNI